MKILIKSLPFDVVICTINESIKGAASLGRYGITFDGNIDVIVHFQHLSHLLFNQIQNQYNYSFRSGVKIMIKVSNWPVRGMKLDLPKNIDKNN